MRFVGDVNPTTGPCLEIDQRYCTYEHNRRQKIPIDVAAQKGIFIIREPVIWLFIEPVLFVRRDRPAGTPGREICWRAWPQPLLQPPDHTTGEQSLALSLEHGSSEQRSASWDGLNRYLPIPPGVADPRGIRTCWGNDACHCGKWLSNCSGGRCYTMLDASIDEPRARFCTGVFALVASPGNLLFPDFARLWPSHPNTCLCCLRKCWSGFSPRPAKRMWTVHLAAAVTRECWQPRSVRPAA